MLSEGLRSSDFHVDGPATEYLTTWSVFIVE